MRHDSAIFLKDDWADLTTRLGGRILPPRPNLLAMVMLISSERWSCPSADSILGSSKVCQNTAEINCEFSTCICPLEAPDSYEVLEPKTPSDCQRRAHLLHPDCSKLDCKDACELMDLPDKPGLMQNYKFPLVCLTNPSN